MTVKSKQAMAANEEDEDNYSQVKLATTPKPQ